MLPENLQSCMSSGPKMKNLNAKAQKPVKEPTVDTIRFAKAMFTRMYTAGLELLMVQATVSKLMAGPAMHAKNLYIAIP